MPPMSRSWISDQAWDSSEGDFSERQREDLAEDIACYMAGARQRLVAEVFDAFVSRQPRCGRPGQFPVDGPLFAVVELYFCFHVDVAATPGSVRVLLFGGGDIGRR